MTNNRKRTSFWSALRTFTLIGSQHINFMNPPGHRPIPAHDLLEHGRRWAAGKQTKLHFYLQTLPTAHLTAWAPPLSDQQWYYKCNMLESSPNYPHSHPRAWKNCLPQNPSLVLKTSPHDINEWRKNNEGKVGALKCKG